MTRFVCRCIALDASEQASMEYTKQLLLSQILTICQKLSPDGTPVRQGQSPSPLSPTMAQPHVPPPHPSLVRRGQCPLPASAPCAPSPPLPRATLSRPACLAVDLLPEASFDVELVVRCVRVSDSPQTHHQALLLLAMAANLFPVSTPAPGPNRRRRYSPCLFTRTIVHAYLPFARHVQRCWKRLNMITVHFMESRGVVVCRLWDAPPKWMG